MSPRGETAPQGPTPAATTLFMDAAIHTGQGRKLAGTFLAACLIAALGVGVGRWTARARPSTSAIPGVVRIVDHDADPVHEHPNDPIWSRFWASVDQPVRDTNPVTRRVFEWAAVQPGMSVAEIGAGGGYYTVRFARMVGLAGRVWATDIDPRMVRKVAWERRSRELFQIVPVEVTEGYLGLPSESVDLMTFIDVGAFRTCEPARNEGYVDQAAAALRRGGRLLVENEYAEDSPQRAGVASADCQNLSPDAIVALVSRRFTLVRREALTQGEGWRGFILLFEKR